MKLSRIITILAITGGLAVAACSDDGGDDDDDDDNNNNNNTGSSSSSSSGQTCSSDHSCINGSCQCNTEGKEGTACCDPEQCESDDSDNCVNKCEVCS